MTIKFGSTSLRDIAKLRDFKRKRVSSYDETGGNDDYLVIAPGERRVIFDEDGPACITHIWTTQSIMGSKFWPRHVIIRIWWDDEKEPSVECPLGDFFGLGHGERINFVSAPLQMSPQDGKGMNCWFPMPFKEHARIEIENDNPDSFNWVAPPFRKIPGMNFYYYVDYELYDEWPEDDKPLAYFHAQFNYADYKRDKKSDRDSGRKLSILEWQFTGGKNTRENGGYEENHVILHAEGQGQYVGCNLNIYNRWRWLPNWPGEGDDMIFIDDDVGAEPTLYGTGTEDYVNTAYCPQQKYSAPYHGIIKGGGPNWTGKITYYRYHIEDPIRFEREIKATIEHGHNNHRGDIWTSTAYWYQIEPHKSFPKLPDRQKRMPKRTHYGRNILISTLVLSLIVVLLYLMLTSW